MGWNKRSWWLGSISDIYIAPGLAKLSGPTFLKDGQYSVKLFSHYHRKAFCGTSARIQLKPEYLASCQSVGYRSCDLQVDTHERKFQLGEPWPCLFLSIDGRPLIGIAKPGFLPHGWVSFDSLAKTKDGLPNRNRRDHRRSKEHRRKVESIAMPTRKRLGGWPTTETQK